MPPLLSLRTSSSRKSSSPSASPRDSKDFYPNESSDADDEHSVDMANYEPQSSRPLSVAIPTPNGSYHPRRPNLHEILNNTSPPPWTLTAFMAYLSQNHCLETLEFTMDAARYRKHYTKMAARSEGGQLAPNSSESQYMQSLWQRLMQAYIQPNGPREVNLPSNVRDGLLNQDNLALPPNPDSLNTAVSKMHELMEESVLVPFLNSYYPQTAHPGSNGSSTEDLNFSAQSYDDRGLYRSRTGRRIMRRSSPSSSEALQSLSTSTPSSASSHPVPINAGHRASAPSSISQFARSFSHSTRHGPPIPHSTSQSPTRPLSSLNPRQNVNSPVSNTSLITRSAAESASSSTPDTAMSNSPDDFSTAPFPILADVSTSSTHASTEPMTPPTTPPTCELSASPTSAQSARGGGNPWKRMRYSFGWRRRTDSHSDDGHSLNSPQVSRNSAEH